MTVCGEGQGHYSTFVSVLLSSVLSGLAFGAVAGGL